MRRFWPWLLLAACVVLIGSGMWLLRPARADRCDARPDDPTGYLQPIWLHGDLHPRNVLVERGAISAVIDWGDITSGDRATDLAAIWMLFDEPRARREALVAYGELSAPTLARAQGWALHFGAMLLDSGMVDNPRHAQIGERTLRRLEAGD